MKVSKKVVTWVAAAALVLGGGVAGTAALTGSFSEPESPAVKLEPKQQDVSVDVEEAPAPEPEPVAPPAPEPAPVVVPEPAPAPPPAPVVPAPAPPAPPKPSGAAAGTPLPFIPSSDPNNAQGGNYTDSASFCASKSASTVGGVPVCD